MNRFIIGANVNAISLGSSFYFCKEELRPAFVFVELRQRSLPTSFTK